MLWFAKLSAASAGRLIRAYFTENSPDRAPGEELKPDNSGRLTAYYTGRDSRATWRADMPFAVSRALGIDPTRPPTNEALDRLFEAKRADSGEKWSKIAARSAPLISRPRRKVGHPRGRVRQGARRSCGNLARDGPGE